MKLLQLVITYYLLRGILVSSKNATVSLTLIYFSARVTPFQLRFLSDTFEVVGDGANNQEALAADRGFRLMYTMVAC